IQTLVVYRTGKAGNREKEREWNRPGRQVDACRPDRTKKDLLNANDQNRTPRATRIVRPPATAAAGNGSGNALMPVLERFVRALPVALPNVAPSLNVVAKPRLSFGPAVFWVTVVFHAISFCFLKRKGTHK